MELGLLHGNHGKYDVSGAYVKNTSRRNSARMSLTPQNTRGPVSGKISQLMVTLTDSFETSFYALTMARQASPIGEKLITTNGGTKPALLIAVI
jgi:hypothetical protein